MGDHTTASYGRLGHSMPPSRTAAGRMGRTAGAIRGDTSVMGGGMLIGDDNRLYGASYPGSPLNLAKERAKSSTPAFSPYASAAASQQLAAASQKLRAQSHTHTGQMGHTPSMGPSHSSPHVLNGRPSSGLRDRPASAHVLTGGGAGGAAAARSASTSRSVGGGVAAPTTSAAAIYHAASGVGGAGVGAKPPSRPSSAGRSAAQQRIASSAGLSVLDRSLPAVRAAAALEEELAAAQLRLAEARDAERQAIAAVRRMEAELREERAARAKAEAEAALARRERLVATSGLIRVSGWGTGTGTGDGEALHGEGGEHEAAEARHGETDPGAMPGDGAGSGGGGRVRPASASSAAPGSASALVASLKREVRSLTATRDALAAQLAELRAGARAQRFLELQAELNSAQEEAARQTELARLVSRRLDAAEAEAAELKEALRAKTDEADAAAAATPLALPSGNTLSKASVRSALAVLGRAHKVLLAEARLIRSTFPPLLSMPEMRHLSAQRPNTAGAVEALVFLGTHVARLLEELKGLPGVPRPTRAPSAGDPAHSSPRLGVSSSFDGASGGAIASPRGAGASPGSPGLPPDFATADVTSMATQAERLGTPGSGTAEAALLGRGVLLSPRSTAAAAQAAAAGGGGALRSVLAGSVAALAAEAREMHGGDPAPPDAPALSLPSRRSRPASPTDALASGSSLPSTDGAAAGDLYEPAAGGSRLGMMTSVPEDAATEAAMAEPDAPAEAAGGEAAEDAPAEDYGAAAAGLYGGPDDGGAEGEEAAAGGGAEAQAMEAGEAEADAYGGVPAEAEEDAAGGGGGDDGNGGGWGEEPQQPAAEAGEAAGVEGHAGGDYGQEGGGADGGALYGDAEYGGYGAGGGEVQEGYPDAVAGAEEGGEAEALAAGDGDEQAAEAYGGADEY
ncbi:hypothetical protein GPECTOR_63g24 [Gonium pectorale]|uniref:Uncharacterized protein n=1 Tax=Gonium pectorale TaxID=33097 RepID=A0A150G490_GONPE|nr:hypothetical protein GPECTOR_63g24 [Gonium pectorale]|eukprot:KXZ44696.1 hypothetical protein GPECTOR_63g24 [Gonium pectorale]